MSLVLFLAAIVIGGLLFMFGIAQTSGWAVLIGALCIALAFIAGVSGRGQRQTST